MIPSEGEEEGITGFGGSATSDFTAAAKGELLGGGAGTRYTGGNEECWVVRERKNMRYLIRVLDRLPSLLAASVLRAHQPPLVFFAQVP